MVEEVGVKVNMDTPTSTEMSETEEQAVTPEPVAGGFSDTEAQAVIQVIETILKNNKNKKGNRA